MSSADIAVVEEASGGDLGADLVKRAAFCPVAGLARYRGLAIETASGWVWA
jgi:hypothetical protein